MQAPFSIAFPRLPVIRAIALVAYISMLSSSSLADECSIILEKNKASLLTKPEEEAGKLQTWIDQLQPDGTWSDISYHDPNWSNWKTSIHLARVYALSRALIEPHSKLYRDVRMKEAIFRALDNWTKNGYRNPNWWHNDIGIPQHLCRILVLVGDQLGEERRKAVLDLYQRQYGRAKAGDGANTIWEAELGLMYGALTQDEAVAKTNAGLIAGEITINGTAGIQDDFSFHQHGPRLQQFAYGGAYGSDMARLAWEMKDTRWAFPPEKLNILADYLLKGSQWMMRGNHTVPGTLDRTISRPQADRLDLRQAASYLAECLPQRAVEFQDLIDRENGKAPPLTGFRAFPRSDFVTYHRPQFSFFLKTLSNRTLPTESINKENLKGHLLSSGDHYLLVNGAEYEAMPPVWDWTLLPGVTVTESAAFLDRKPLVGSVGDASSGLSIMDYQMKCGTGTISARKAWAMHGDVVVCLIGDLRTDGLTELVRTALDQSRLEGPVTVATGSGAPKTMLAGSHDLNDVHWIQHGHFAYIPLGPAHMTLRLGPVTGDWRSINFAQSSETISKTVFLPVLEHGTNPQGQSTGYVLAACSTPDQATALVAHPTWTVLRNDAQCQAVRFTDGTLMAAFYASGRLEENGKLLLEAAHPSLILKSNGETTTFDPPSKIAQAP